MADVFFLAWLFVGIGLHASVRLFRDEPGRGGGLAWRYLPHAVIFGVLAAYLVMKVVYEEIYPCVAADSRYCVFDSTQYHNLFGWEF